MPMSGNVDPIVVMFRFVVDVNESQVFVVLFFALEMQRLCHCSSNLCQMLRRGQYHDTADGDYGNGSPGVLQRRFNTGNLIFQKKQNHPYDDDDNAGIFHCRNPFSCLTLRNAARTTPSAVV